MLDIDTVPILFYMLKIKQSAYWMGVFNAKSGLRIICLGLLLFVGNLYAETQHLIVNINHQKDSLSRNTARAIFSMRLQRWEDGSPIKVFVLPDEHPAHQMFAREILALFPHQLRRSWDRYVYSGIGTAPIEVESEEDMIERVAAAPGSIGYSSMEILNENIRTISVQ